MTMCETRIRIIHFSSACAVGAACLLLASCGHDTGARSAGSSASDSTSRSSTSAASAAPAIPATGSADTALQPLPSSRAAGGGIELFPAATIARAADALAHGPTTGRTFASYPGLHYVQSRRSTSGSPEVHDQWLDVTVVQAGRATLLTGGRVEGGSLTTPDEHRGGKIIGGSSRRLGAGDLITIPAGVPHQYQLAPGDTIRYLTIKVKRSSGG